MISSFISSKNITRFPLYLILRWKRNGLGPEFLSPHNSEWLWWSWLWGNPGQRRRKVSHSLRGAREESEESSSLTWALKGVSQVEKEHGGRASPREQRRCCGGLPVPRRGCAPRGGTGHSLYLPEPDCVFIVPACQADSLSGKMRGLSCSA